MKKLALFLIRDRQSYEYSSSFLEDNIKESIDVAFSLPYKYQATDIDDRVRVGMNISGLLWNGGYTRSNQFGLKVDYQSLCKKIIEHFRAKDKIKIILIPHVINQSDDHIESDYGVSSIISKEFNLDLAPRFKSPIEAKSYISGLDFFIGARMHSCIAAFSSNVPVVPLSYSRKFNGLFADTLDYEYIGDCLNNTENEIIELIEDSFNNRALLKDKIERINKNTVAPRLKELKDILSSLI